MDENEIKIYDCQVSDDFWYWSDREKDSMAEFIKGKSLRRWCYHVLIRFGEFPHPLKVAALGDVFRKEARAIAIYETAKILGYEVVTKEKLTNYRRRRTPKIKLGRKALYFLRKKP